MVRAEVGISGRFLLWARSGWAEMDAREKWTGAVRAEQLSGLGRCSLGSEKKDRNGLNPWVQPAPLDRGHNSRTRASPRSSVRRHGRLGFQHLHRRRPCTATSTVDLQHVPRRPPSSWCRGLHRPSLPPCPLCLLGRRLPLVTGDASLSSILSGSSAWPCCTFFTSPKKAIKQEAR